MKIPIVTTKKATVLVVDDQRTMIKLMERMLSDEYTVLTAKSGKSAIETARMKLPDIILLDTVMPEMSAIEVCQLLRKDPMTCAIATCYLSDPTKIREQTKALLSV